MTKNDKTRKDTNRVGGELSWNDLIQVKDIGKERVKRKSKSRSEELLMDGNIAIGRMNGPISFIGRHQPIPTRDVVMSP